MLYDLYFFLAIFFIFEKNGVIDESEETIADGFTIESYKITMDIIHF